MGWKNDWLYRLIFQQARFIWDRFDPENRSDGPLVSSLPLIIQECQRSEWRSAFVAPPIVRAWRYDGDQFEPLDPTESEATYCPEVRGIRYSIGLVRFAIVDDRRRVVFTYVLGPRYGRARVWQVKGQGGTGKLVPEPEAEEWIY